MVANLTAKFPSPRNVKLLTIICIAADYFKPKDLEDSGCKNPCARAAVGYRIAPGSIRKSKVTDSAAKLNLPNSHTQANP